jgi:hypothetical protein
MFASRSMARARHPDLSDPDPAEARWWRTPRRIGHRPAGGHEPAASATGPSATRCRVRAGAMKRRLFREPCDQVRGQPGDNDGARRCSCRAPHASACADHMSRVAHDGDATDESCEHEDARYSKAVATRGSCQQHDEEKTQRRSREGDRCHASGRGAGRNPWARAHASIVARISQLRPTRTETAG